MVGYFHYLTMDTQLYGHFFIHSIDSYNNLIVMYLLPKLMVQGGVLSPE